jgi:hypothetical protein
VFNKLSLFITRAPCKVNKNYKKKKKSNKNLAKTIGMEKKKEKKERSSEVK